MRFWRFVAVFSILVALATGAIVYDRLAKPLDFPTPDGQGPTVSVTTTLAPVSR